MDLEDIYIYNQQYFIIPVYSLVFEHRIVMLNK